MRGFVVCAASWFGTGFFPVASGTVGTLGAIPLYLVLARLPLWLYLLTLVPFFFLASWVSGAAEREFGEKDSGKIVIDEVIGFLITMAGAPVHWRSIVIGFLLFRFFDIVKVPPARYFDRQVKNGYGVVLDDVVAGIYACVVLHVILRFL
ncbi:phosphatidylglycerophosphatase A [Geobacter metallireducens RCH3]|uniref:Phosphatidylglycerophosphatase A n=1 Tax=Geobacter metallireducens (strain ATCC 53774 / DSM 7210 / GS-15) TaxID=269799 RepID=Q39Z83_GEOMG|nr:phosphatidylglycerophosphatase A [Geobacter metallireducens]ABB30441.1 phosphatidylglycerophosphatase A [Geobacter metallireducens GS-15]EHP87318.1 phosphatidylglycerophosphatase A [Geobacter metallireducens RCH3]